MLHDVSVFITLQPVVFDVVRTRVFWWKEKQKRVSQPLKTNNEFPILFSMKPVVHITHNLVFGMLRRKNKSSHRRCPTPWSVYHAKKTLHDNQTLTDQSYGSDVEQAELWSKAYYSECDSTIRREMTSRCCFFRACETLERCAQLTRRINICYTN